MKRGTRLLMAFAVVAAVFPLAGTAQSQDVTCPTAEDFKPPPFGFSEPMFIDKHRAGGEPVSVVAQDGSISVSAHAGTTHVYKNPSAAPGTQDFVDGYYNQTLNWRSEDGGETWEYVGLLGTGKGPHTPHSTGFSDPDFSMDQAGNIYNTEINLANVSVFSSTDDGKSYPIANPVAASGDRPWVTGQEPGEVFLYVNQPKSLWRSTDIGQTFTLVSASFPASGKLYSDPLNPDHGLIGSAGVRGIAISEDDGTSWTRYPANGSAALGPSTQFFGAPAIDRAGNIYIGAAGGYGGSNDTDPNGSVTFNYFNRETNEFAPEAVNIPIPTGDALWPWLTAGDRGRAAITWYQTLDGNQDEFYIFVAYTHNAMGTNATCSDGSTVFIPPQFQVANASGRPIHVGKICLSGTTCNANPSFEGGDRRMGDFFTINFDHDGKLFIASGDTTLKSAAGTAKPVGNPIFIKQAWGGRMLVGTDWSRESRCLYPLPSC